MLKNKREMKKKGGFKRKRNSRDRQRKSNTWVTSVSEEETIGNRTNTDNYNSRKFPDVHKKLKWHIEKLHHAPEIIDPKRPIARHSLVKFLAF
jgi:hypothetical protein